MSSDLNCQPVTSIRTALRNYARRVSWSINLRHVIEKISAKTNCLPLSECVLIAVFYFFYDNKNVLSRVFYHVIVTISVTRGTQEVSKKNSHGVFSLLGCTNFG